MCKGLEPHLLREKLYDWSSTFIYLSLVVIVLCVPLLFSSWTFQSNYIKGVFLEIAILASVTVWLLRTILSGRVTVIKSPLNLAVLLYYSLAITSALLSQYPLMSGRALWRVTVFVLLYFVTANFVTTPRRGLGILVSVAFSALLVSGYAFAQKLGYDPIHWSQSPGDRTFSSIGNANMLAGYLVMMISFSCGLAFAVESWAFRCLGITAGLVSSGALLLTQTKASWLALLVSMGMMFLGIMIGKPFKNRKWRKTEKLFFISSAIMLIILIGLQARPAIERFKTTLGSSARVRLACWQGALGIFRDHPLIGTGIGTFQVLFPVFRPADFKSIGGTDLTLHAHSEYLETMADQGVLGEAVLVILISTFFMVAIKGLRNLPNKVDCWVMCAILAAVTGILAQSAVDVVLRWYVCPSFLWIAFGLTASICDSDKIGHFSFQFKKSQQFSATILCVALVIVTAHVFVVRPFHAQINLNTSTKYIKMKQWDNAIHCLQSAITGDSINFEAYNQLGQAYYKSGNYLKASEIYRALQAHSPHYGQVHRNLGIVLSAIGDVRAATDEFALSAKLGMIPENTDIAALVKKITQEEALEGKRLALLKLYVRTNSDDKAGWVELGTYYLDKGHIDEASNCFRTALQIDKNYVPALDNLAGAYYQQGDFTKAIEICHRVLDINPQAARTHTNLGRAYFMMGNKAKAVEHWRKAVSIDPHHESEAQKLLSNIEPVDINWGER